MAGTDVIAGAWSPESFANEYMSLVFVISQMIAEGATCAWVQVVSCSNTGGAAAVGTVTVRPVVNQVTAAGTAVPPGEISNIPYLRLQGGSSAVIMDPSPNDFGLAIFAARDSSAALKAAIGTGLAAGAAVNPGSRRQYSWSDGVYIGGMLNAVPTQYVQMLAGGGGVNIVTPGTVTIQGNQITLSGPINANGATISAAGEVTDAKGIVLGTHEHSAGTYVAPSGGGPVTGDSGEPA
jgi:hypothetical protein